MAFGGQHENLATQLGWGGSIQKQEAFLYSHIFKSASENF